MCYHLGIRMRLTTGARQSKWWSASSGLYDCGLGFNQSKFSSSNPITPSWKCIWHYFSPSDYYSIMCEKNELSVFKCPLKGWNHGFLPLKYQLFRADLLRGLNVTRLCWTTISFLDCKVIVRQTRSFLRNLRCKTDPTEKSRREVVSRCA